MTLPPLFPVEHENNNKAYAYVKSITKPIFDKVPQETSKNHMMVGEVGKPAEKFCFYNPHNYRVYIDYKRNSNPPFEPTKPCPRGWVSPRRINGTEFIIKTELFNIRVKKNQLEIQTKINTWNSLNIYGNLESQLFEIIRKKDNVCLSIAKIFIEKFGGFSNFEILNRSSENKIEGEDFIDILDIKMRFHSKIAKKVYLEKNIEHPDPAFTLNHLKNSALNDFAPEIVEAFNCIYQTITKEFMPVMADFSENIKSHTAVVKKMSEGFDRFNEILPKIIPSNNIKQKNKGWVKYFT